jgi:hypothetical protein
MLGPKAERQRDITATDNYDSGLKHRLQQGSWHGNTRSALGGTSSFVARYTVGSYRDWFDRNRGLGAVGSRGSRSYSRSLQHCRPRRRARSTDRGRLGRELGEREAIPVPSPFVKQVPIEALKDGALLLLVRNRIEV